MVAQSAIHRLPMPSTLECEGTAGKGEERLKNSPLSTFSKEKRNLLLLSVHELLQTLDTMGPDVNTTRASLQEVYHDLQVQRSLDELFEEQDPHAACMAVVSYSRAIITQAHERAGHPPAAVEVNLRFENGSANNTNHRRL